jgi:hypothetical protein
MCMPLLDVQTWLRVDVLGLGLTDRDVSLLRGPHGASLLRGPHGFTGTYRLVEKDMIAYRSRTRVRMHDAWVLRERHGTVRMLLIGCTVCVCQYWTYGRD